MRISDWSSDVCSSDLRPERDDRLRRSVGAVAQRHRLHRRAGLDRGQEDARVERTDLVAVAGAPLREHDFDDATLKLHMRELTEWLVQRHTDFGTLYNYFDGYSLPAADRTSAAKGKRV